MALRIGDLARRAGLSVRALRHYDSLGLLRPSQRSAVGYRLYGQADVMRLHAILTLKSFGCSLAEIRRALETGQEALPGILSRQIVALEEKIAGAKALSERIKGMLSRMERNVATDMGDWLDVLGMMHLLRGYFSEAELALLRGGPGRRGWRELTGRIAAALEAGIPPDAPQGRDLARAALAMARQAAGGDPALLAKLRAMVAREEGVLAALGFSPRVRAWLDAAVAAASSAAVSADGAALPTGTALGVATLRAAHQLLDDSPVFVDRLALAMVGPGREAVIRNAAAGFDPAAPAFFSWLGVTMHLPEAAVGAVLEAVAAMAPGTEIVYDYSVAPALLSAGERRAREAVADRAAAKGEPWLSSFVPGEMAARLADLGFGVVQDWTGDELSARYLAGRRDGLRKSGLTRIIAARLAAPAADGLEISPGGDWQAQAR
ncbi:MerR family transcriptional regulator [Solidesulfovibrio sp.]|uniref:MerR family transcriptional regulator n=1 Tax=Solidesulfovibrio sp. TaxID=2910990 RepID=UPI00263022A9|nr:MerR family transcriptional regulator [Solidesulfovibrio sp.]